MDNLIFEKIKNNKSFHYDLINSFKLNHISINFRIKNNTEGTLVLILNLCLLEKLLCTSFIFLKQKKNIRTFAPVGSVIGGSFLIKKKHFFLNHLIFFWWSKQNFFYQQKKSKEYNPSVSFSFSLSSFLQFSFFKFNRSSWETFSYLYEKQIYGLNINLSFDTRYYLFRRLLLSSNNLNMSDNV
jgi:hypothetical protein